MRWELELRGRPVSLNAERKGHWSDRAEATQDFVQQAKILAKAAKIPRLECILVEATPFYPNLAGHTDVGNVYPSVKAAIDGIVKAGVIPDDKPPYVQAITFRIPVIRRGEIGLTIEVIGDPV